MADIDKTVLVVEDDEKLNRMMKYLFMSKGYKVESAINGLDALDVLEKTKPDIIILDLMMPKMDGFELCERLKRDDSQYKDIPVIILTALKEDKNKDKLKSMGASDYIEKPFGPLDLIERVLKLL